MGSPRQNVNCGPSNSKYACVFVRDIIIWLTIEDCWESSTSSPSLLHYELTRNIQNKSQRVLTKPMNFADTKSISKEKHQTLRTIQTCWDDGSCAMLYEKNKSLKDTDNSFTKLAGYARQIPPTPKSANSQKWEVPARGALRASTQAPSTRTTPICVSYVRRLLAI